MTYVKTKAQLHGEGILFLILGIMFLLLSLSGIIGEITLNQTVDFPIAIPLAIAALLSGNYGFHKLRTAEYIHDPVPPPEESTYEDEVFAVKTAKGINFEIHAQIEFMASENIHNRLPKVKNLALHEFVVFYKNLDDTPTEPEVQRFINTKIESLKQQTKFKFLAVVILFIEPGNK
jgi:hypothetical protein